MLAALWLSLLPTIFCPLSLLICFSSRFPDIVSISLDHDSSLCILAGIDSYKEEQILNKGSGLAPACWKSGLRSSKEP